MRKDTPYRVFLTSIALLVMSCFTAVARHWGVDARPRTVITDWGDLVRPNEPLVVESVRNDSIEWHDPQDSLLYLLQGSIAHEALHSFRRIPADWLSAEYRHEGTLSSGLSIAFYSSSPRLTIEVTYDGSPIHALPDVVLTDLYSTDSHGRTTFVPAVRATASRGTLETVYEGLKYDNPHPYGNHYRIYLPTGVLIRSVRVGNSMGEHFEWVQPRLEVPIVVAGALPTRRPTPSDGPAAFIQKTLDFTTLDFTLSHPRALDSVFMDRLAHLPSRLYILSFTGPTAAALTSEEIVQRIQQLRSISTAPILLAESADATAESAGEQRAAYQQLTREGLEKLHYQSDKTLITDVVAALGLKTEWVFPPITQARDRKSYRWEQRHNQVIERNRHEDPEVLVIGNSIMNYWSGLPAAKHHRGDSSWAELFGDRRVTNMGFGWDRIENLNWRILHGELDDCSPAHIFLMIGTNNLSINDPTSKIAAGVLETVQLIRAKQPKARLHVLSITPRREQEATVRELNRQIKTLVEGMPQVHYINIHDALTLPDSGGKIDETLFSDGLHPNTEGYQRIADRLRQEISDLE